MAEVFVSPILCSPWISILREVDFEVFSLFIRILPESFIVEVFGRLCRISKNPVVCLCTSRASRLKIGSSCMPSV